MIPFPRNPKFAPPRNKRVFLYAILRISKGSIKFSHASLLSSPREVKQPIALIRSLSLWASVLFMALRLDPRWRSIRLIPLAKCRLIAFQSPYSVHLSLRKNWKRQQTTLKYPNCAFFLAACPSWNGQSIPCFRKEIHSLFLFHSSSSNNGQQDQEQRIL